MWKVLSIDEKYRIVETDGRYELIPAEMPAIEMPAFFCLTYSQADKAWYIKAVAQMASEYFGISKGYLETVPFMSDIKIENQTLCGGPEAFCLFRAEGKVWLQPGWPWWRKGEFRGCLPEISLEEEFFPLIDYAKGEIRLLRKSEVVKI